MHHIPHSPGPRDLASGSGDPRILPDEDAWGSGPFTFSLPCTGFARRDVECLLSSALQDHGFGTFDRIQRIFDRMHDYDD